MADDAADSDSASCASHDRDVDVLLLPLSTSTAGSTVVDQRGCREKIRDTWDTHSKKIRLMPIQWKIVWVSPSLTQSPVTRLDLRE